uniref:7TM_GPCR_Srx domain-containing protein n=1 Tax=Panagrellus redivivus TaxID=6233 RepID=A0A7E4ZPY9_PANRE
MYVMSFLFIVRPIVQTTEVIFICADGENNNALLYIHCVRDMAVIGIRFIWLEVGVERIIATVYVGTYEKSMMMFSVIRNKNKTFRQLSNLTGERALKLTEKYQIIENIRSMDYLIPHSNIDAVTDLITVVASFFGRYFYDRIGSAAIYNFGLNIQMVAFAIYWTKRNQRLRKLLRRSHAKAVGPLMTNASRSAASDHRKDVHFVKNPLGDRIQKKQTLEEHFVSLKTMWK